MFLRCTLTSLFLLAMFSTPTLGHEGGHGPQVTDAGKRGGVLAPVIEAKDAKKGAHAAMIYKSELVRAEDGTVRVYLYDKDMAELDLSKFGTDAKGFLEFKKNKKWTKMPFALKQAEGAFIAKAPKSPTRPFNIDVHVTQGGRDLMAAFDNLD